MLLIEFDLAVALPDTRGRMEHGHPERVESLSAVVMVILCRGC